MIDIRERLKLRKSIRKLLQCDRKPTEIAIHQFYRGGNRGTEKLGKILQIGSDRVRSEFLCALRELGRSS